MGRKVQGSADGSADDPVVQSDGYAHLFRVGLPRADGAFDVSEQDVTLPKSAERAERLA